jgi:hypothetical protein
MSRDEIIAMAKEADPFGESGRLYAIAELTPETLERFAALVAAKEREACAALAQATVCDTHIPTGVKIYGTRAAAAIRARDKP